MSTADGLYLIISPCPTGRERMGKSLTTEKENPGIDMSQPPETLSYSEPPAKNRQSCTDKVSSYTTIWPCGYYLYLDHC